MIQIAEINPDIPLDWHLLFCLDIIFEKSFYPKDLSFDGEKNLKDWKAVKII